ncbi:hypothetical protein [Meiothermus rufus]|uniref:hypothetical protein n=1 Tax=Meiothermus rufus TaxID=604332 RepID=UPI000428A7ED|nr:hypothetical protein [Meiothermus rufus]
MDELGPFARVWVEHGVDLGMGLNYALDRAWSARLDLRLGLVWRVEERNYGDGLLRLGESQANGNGSFRLGYRLDPESPLDPRLSFSLTYPWGVGLGLGLGLLRDPVVLEVGGRVELLGGAGVQVGLEGGLGFVANDWVSLVFSGGLFWPVGTVAPPLGGLGVRVLYRLEESPPLELGVEGRLWVQGQAVRLGLELSLQGAQGP